MSLTINLSNNLFASGKKLALIVAIAKYEHIYPADQHGWKEISSEKDVPIVVSVLNDKGFNSENITIIKNDQATLDGIRKAITELSSKISPGDIIFFHFSGHGQQVKDNNPPEEADGFDECIVPYDAPAWWGEQDVYKGEKHLGDDEFGEMVNLLRSKAGNDGQVIISIDACYSGTITRGIDESPMRGGESMPVGYLPKASTEDGRSGLVDENFTSRGNENDLAKYVVFSGASANEPNYEAKDDNGNSIGSLSLSISMALAKTGPGESYRQMFEDVKSIMAERIKASRKQTPQIEGNIDEGVFKGDVEPIKPYYLVDRTDETGAFIKGGKLTNIFKGCVVEFRDAKGKEVYAKGTITDVREFASYAEITGSWDKDKVQKSWVYVTEQTYGDINLKVKIADNIDINLKNNLLPELAKMKIIDIVNDNPDLIISHKDFEGNTKAAPTVFLNTSYKTTLCEIPDKTPDIVTAIVDSVKEYAISNYIRNITFDEKGSKIKCNLEIEPIEVEKDKFGTKIKEVRSISEKTTSGNQIRFKIGDYFQLKVTNNGEVPVFISILDIGPDGKLQVAFPLPGEKIDASLRKLRPGQSFVVPGDFYKFVLRFSGAAGTDTYKLFATTDDIDFAAIFGTRGRSRGNGNPLEVLFGEVMEGTRGPEPVATTGMTFSLPVELVK